MEVWKWLYMLALDSHAPVAQLDRVADFESEGWGFDSLRARFSQIGISGFFYVKNASYGFDNACLRHFYVQFSVSNLFQSSLANCLMRANTTGVPQGYRGVNRCSA